jgi:hypothetical protein
VRIDLKEVPIVNALIDDEPDEAWIESHTDNPPEASNKPPEHDNLVIVLTEAEPEEIMGPPVPPDYRPIDEQIHVQGQKVDDFEDRAKNIEKGIRKKKAHEKGLQVRDQL